jgi:hypothetical protein
MFDGARDFAQDITGRGLEVFVRSEGRVDSTRLGSITRQNDRVLRLNNTGSF